jgi:hypothetical protein
LNDQRIALSDVIWEAIRDEEPIRRLVAEVSEFFAVGFRVLARVGVEFFGDCFGVVGIRVVGEDEPKDLPLVVEDVVNEARFGFGVFNVVFSHGECEVFGVVEGDGAGAIVFKFGIERVLMFVVFEAMVFLSLREENEVAWVPDIIVMPGFTRESGEWITGASLERRGLLVRQ